MSAIIMSVFLAMAPAHPAPQVQALREATRELEVTRARWDAAVAGDHPVAAGKWARRHFEAMQNVKAVKQRLAIEQARARPSIARR